MKFICLLFLLLCAAPDLFAQKPVAASARPQPVNPAKDKQDYQGYTIRLLPALPMPQQQGNYGFAIFKDNKAVLHQVESPLLSPHRLQKKEHAFTAARWLIDEYKKTGRWQRTVPPHVARQLKIITH